MPLMFHWAVCNSKWPKPSWCPVSCPDGTGWGEKNQTL